MTLKGWIDLHLAASVAYCRTPIISMHPRAIQVMAPIMQPIFPDDLYNRDGQYLVGNYRGARILKSPDSVQTRPAIYIGDSQSRIVLFGTLLEALDEFEPEPF
jgi:hypothetical protein